MNNKSQDQNQDRNPQGHGNSDILVVEDSETQAEYLAHLLSSNGFRVRIARNGRLGLEQAKAARPALVVSDIAMPEMDGFEMCRQLKQDHSLRDVPVILLTVLTSLYDVIKGLDCGADNFIRKPFEGQYLLGRIQFILANRAMRSNEKVQFGVQVNLGGQTHFVNAERQQIFDLLISTYEEAINMTEELKAQQRRIARSYQSLEGLYQLAATLNPAVTDKDVAEKALERVLDFPGVAGACLGLLDADGSLRVAAAQISASGPRQPVVCTDCACARKLADSGLRRAAILEDCAMFRAVGKQAGSTLLGVPLAGRERVLGMLVLQSVAGTVFGEDDIQALEAVGNQIAMAMERANLYTHMERLVDQRTRALQAERNLLSAVVDTAAALVFLIDRFGRIVVFNPACERALGWKFEEVKGRVFWDLFLKPDQAGPIKEYFEKLDFSGFPTQRQTEWLARDGSSRNIIWSTRYLQRPDQNVEYFLGTGLDVTELRMAEERVQYLSNFDGVTGLPNRILLRDRIRMLQDRAATGKEVMGFMLIHFPRLPAVRENLGSAAEHAVLLQVARRLKGWAAGDDSVARFSDESFAAVALRRDPAALSAVARQLLVLLEQVFLSDGQELHLEASIGITIFPDDGDDFDALVRGAEVAMRRTPAGYMERCHFYTPQLDREANERFWLEGALRKAMERNEFFLHYQPQADLRTGKIIGLEALLRWRHPEAGMIAPGRFIGLAEETGLILPIGKWVLRKACEQACAWQKMGLPGLPVAVNLSARQFTNGIAETVREILDETGLEPGLLELELTESVSMHDPENTIGILRTLKEMGVSLSIDDFGTGYSNLNYLKRFPVDKLKLDQSFVRDLTSDADDLSIARAVISMAHSLRLKVIAEGVETKGQLALLAQNGCNEIQGYLLSKPVDATTCTGLLRDRQMLTLGRLERERYERTVLLVDRDLRADAPLARWLSGQGYKVHVANDAGQAFELLAIAEIGVVLCDHGLAGLGCAEFLSRVGQLYPAIIRIMASGRGEAPPENEAVPADDMVRRLERPWSDAALATLLDEAVRQFESRPEADASRIPVFSIRH
jgi:PAS domain S-box-containing protein/diguanylate cyclase (GGDEF)-like protein